ncbi:hypothetical protein JTB14_010014 [Gonioctena quinquepunctata]|nr:hypothetical protein JTB14_010014 [Gonioctena quinquepunctata]
MELDRKKKSVSFSVEEQLRLLDLINKEKNIIENKTTNKFTNDEKDKAWQRVTAAFNALALHRRNMDQLKSKYDNLKTKTRKVVAAQRTYIKGTGGGPSVTDKFDPVIENVLKIINIKTVVGFDSILDCDDDLDTGNEADDFSTTETGHTNYVEKQIPDLPILIIHDTNKESEPSESHTAEEIVSHCTQDNGENSTTNLDLGNEATGPASLKKLKRKWSSYTPYKLKEPVTRQLRPTVMNPAILAKEAFYKKKIDLLEKQVWAIEEENRRQEEAHMKKQIILDLQISELQRIPIPPEKYEDLQHLKKYCGPAAQEYFNNLPKKDAKRTTTKKSKVIEKKT